MSQNDLCVSLFSALPLPCLSGCSCYYSVDHEANTMNCSFNNMTTLPAKLLPGTELLIMTGNNLGNLDSVPENFPVLKQLDLTRCNIWTTSSKVMKIFFSKIDNLNLSNNKMKQISRIIQTEEFHAKLWLSKNPYECNCDMMWMRDWLQNASNVVDKENITCASGKWEGNQRSNFIPVYHFLLPTNKFHLPCRKTNSLA